MNRKTKKNKANIKYFLFNSHILKVAVSYSDSIKTQWRKEKSVYT